VSSTFHLRRLADETEKHVEEPKHKQIASKISKIILIGAECDDKEDVVMFEDYYVKNMLFEVYCVFRFKVATYSRRMLPPIPFQSCH
jgi:hypothetical protein